MLRYQCPWIRKQEWDENANYYEKIGLDGKDNRDNVLGLENENGMTMETIMKR